MILDKQNGKVYQAKSDISSKDLLQIAAEAKSAKYYDGYVQWLETAFFKAKAENLDFK